MESVPIFPLPLVLFPATRLPLQIFELRYRRMVKECLANETGFVITYARNYGAPSAIGKRPSATAQNPSDKKPSGGMASIATYCEIIDWQPMPNEMIGILVQGLLKVRIVECGSEPDGLITGAARILEAEAELTAMDQSAALAGIFQRLQEEPLVSLLPLNLQAGNAQNISYQLADLLPFSIQQKQHLLQLDGPAERLEQILLLLKES